MIIENGKSEFLELRRPATKGVEPVVPLASANHSIQIPDLMTIRIRIPITHHPCRTATIIAIPTITTMVMATTR